MKFYFDKKVVRGFLIAITILVWLGVYSFLNSKKFTETSGLVAHTNEVLYHSEQTLTTIMDMESNQRGYILTSDTSFLGPIKLSGDTVLSHLENLTQLTNDNADQQKKLAALKPLVKEKIEFIKNTIAAHTRSFNESSDSIQSLKGLNLMAKIKIAIADIQAEEKKLLQARIKSTQAGLEKFNYAFTALLITTAVILILVFAAINLSLKSRTKTELALKTAAEETKDLYENAPCGYYSLDTNGTFVNINETLLSWIGYERSEVIQKMKFTQIVTTEGQAITEERANFFNEKFLEFKAAGSVYNVEFEFVKKNGQTFPIILNSTAVVDSKGNFIKSRSTVFDMTAAKKAENKIKLLNKELEAFTYSVSHDLRSPLRSIDGYTKILEEDYGKNMDAEAKRLMSVIMSNAKRMGQLIDDLLDFSHIGRKELTKSAYDVEQIIKSVKHDLLEHETGREINFTIHNLKPTVADVAMIRQVWVNLISNALKYTRKVKAAHIEIGSFQSQDEVGYFIKDNGVGFDMTYVHKLFGVFQRLHRVQDFEGTGVGLAIVYRIISKHGGRVWAESKLNEGATFFFTLPNE